MLLALATILTVSQAAQAAQPSAADEVRAMVQTAIREAAYYDAAGRPAGGADHPAVKWDAALWAARERYVGTDAGAIASAEAIRLLLHAGLWNRAEARVESLDPDEQAWERVPAVLYEAAIARNDLPSVIERLSREAGATSKSSNKAAALLIVGRAQRRAGDRRAAIETLERVQAIASGTPRAEEAAGLVYEIQHLSPGLEAPAVSGRARNGARVDLRSYRGTPAVLVFWGTT